MGIMDEEGGHVVTTSIEHSSVFESCRALEKRGVAVTYVPSRGNGIVDSRAVAAAIRPDTRLVSIMYANNEIGTVQPIREIAKIVRAMRASGGSPYPLLHTDACQAGGALDISMPRLGVDLATFNGSKLYGPKGVGFFYKKRGVTLTPLMRGGGQERGVRGGTENVPGIVGVAEALEIAENKREREVTRLMKLRDYFLDTVLEKISGTHINGDRMNRLPGNANITFDGVSGEALVIALDALGIAAGTGSACASAATAGRQGGLDPSHVILALGESEAYARSSVRFSLGRSTTKRDLDYVIKVLMDIVRQFRRGIL
jgi:cysteine desulfurase